MLKFGIFRKTRGKPTEIAEEFDPDGVYSDLLEGIHKNLPELPKKRRFYHVNPRGWTKAEISVAFLKSWDAMEKIIKRATLRIS